MLLSDYQVAVLKEMNVTVWKRTDELLVDVQNVIPKCQFAIDVLNILGIDFVEEENGISIRKNDFLWEFTDSFSFDGHHLKTLSIDQLVAPAAKKKLWNTIIDFVTCKIS